MKKAKILSVITMFIAIVLIVTGYSIIFISEYTVDARETNSYASLIKNSYKSYSADLGNISFEINRTTIFNVNYYSEIKLNYSRSIEELERIESHIKEVESISSLLLHECSVRNYNDYDIDDKCETINYNYESIINAYVSIVNKYNERIDSYNDWSNNTNALQKYKPTYYKDYVDINLDGEYLGIIG